MRKHIKLLRHYHRLALSTDVFDVDYMNGLLIEYIKYATLDQLNLFRKVEQMLKRRSIQGSIVWNDFTAHLSAQTDVEPYVLNWAAFTKRNQTEGHAVLQKQTTTSFCQAVSAKKAAAGIAQKADMAAAKKTVEQRRAARNSAKRGNGEVDLFPTFAQVSKYKEEHPGVSPTVYFFSPKFRGPLLLWLFNSGVNIINVNGICALSLIMTHTHKRTAQPGSVFFRARSACSFPHSPRLPSHLPVHALHAQSTHSVTSAIPCASRTVHAFRHSLTVSPSP